MSNFDKFRKEHPFGTSLLLRDTTDNRRIFPDGPFGTIDVAENSCALTGECPHYHYSADQSENNSLNVPIHILVAAFRDRLCSRTLHNAFSKAKNPKRIFIRVIDQTQPGSTLPDDEGCWIQYCRQYNTNCGEYKNQVRVVRVDAGKSLGPTWARSKLSAMINWDHVHRDDSEEVLLTPVDLEDFCMQIDSHMDFSDSFDQGLIQMFHRTENDYAVLSTYVADIEQNNKDPKTVPNLCLVEFTSSIRNWATKECRGLQRPKMTNAMWGAGLSFHRCHAELNVPVDPYTEGVFDGEEGSRGIRFFTHGYDVYTPDKVLVTHDYHTHQGNPIVHTWGRGLRRGKNENEKMADAEIPNESVFEDNWKWMAEIDSKREEWHTTGFKRLNMLLSIGSYFNSTQREATEVEKIRNSRYGIGTKRTLEQAREFTGINLVEEKLEANRCGNLNWVPFEESPGYGVEETLARPIGVPVTSELKPGVLVVEAGKSSRLLRSLSHVDFGSINDARTGSNTNFAQSFMDYRVGGGLAVAGFVVVILLTTVRRRKKDQRHYD